MTKNIYIDVSFEKTRIAIVENGIVVEFCIERNSRNKIVGNIYKGRVENVLKGMQAAFVDFGREKNGFLYVGDMMMDATELAHDENLKIPSSLDIKKGDEIMIQVVKEEFGSKGARVSTSISLAGRFLVYMPQMDYVGISRKIEDEDKKEKLIDTLQSFAKKSGGGFIIRTAAEFASKKELLDDAKFLINLWKTVAENYKDAKVADNIYNDGSLVFRIIRDAYTSNTETIFCNDESTIKYVEMLLSKMANGSRTKLVYFDRWKDMFDEFGLTEQVEGFLQKKVPIEGGAYLVIDKTEALTVIDVNSGKYIGNSCLENTVFEVNTLAAKEIARQLRARDIGGIIVVDFIDMHDDKHKESVLKTLEDSLKNDRIRSHVKGMSELGLVEITRKKSRNEVLSILTQECPYCNGKGYVYSNEYMLVKIRSEIMRCLGKESRGVIVECSKEVFGSVFSSSELADEINKIFPDKKVYFSSKPYLRIEEFIITPFKDKVVDLPNNSKMLC